MDLRPQTWRGQARSAAGALLYFAVSTALFFRAILFAGHQFHIPYDLHDYHYPLTELIAWSLRQFGQLPWWNPFSYSGEPLSGNITTAMFYPTTLATVLAGNALYGRVPYSFMELQVVAHVFFGGVGMFILLRALGCGRPASFLGGTVFQFGGFFASQTQHLGAICGAAWLPWLALAVRYLAQRRNFLGVSATGAVLAMMVLAGFPAIFLPAYVFGGLWLLGWAWPEAPENTARNWVRALGRPVLLFTLACLFSAALAAVALLPSFDVARLSVATMRPRSQAITGLYWESLTSLLVPNLFSQLRGNYWGTCNFTFMYLYQGLPALMLATAALGLRPVRRAVVFWISAGFAFLWMFGATFFLSEVIFILFPGFAGRGIYPDFVLAYFGLSVAALAAFALDAAEHDELRMDVKPWRTAALVALALGIAGYAACPAFSNEVTRLRIAVAAGSFLYVALIGLMACLLLARLGAVPPLRRPLLTAAVVALALLDLVATGSSSAPNTYEGNAEQPAKVEGVETPEEVFRIIAEHAKSRGYAEPYRIDTSDLGYGWQTLFPLRRVASANGMNAVLLLDYLRFRSAFSTSIDRQFRLDQADSPLLDLLNVRYVISSREEIPGLERIYSGFHKIFENPEAVPRFYLVPQVLPVKSVDEAVAALKEGDFDLKLAATVQGGPLPNLPFGEGASCNGSVKLLHYSPNEIKLQVTSGRPCLLVAAETYWPEWRARVDSKLVPILRTNGVQRGVFIPAGTHSVRMRLVPIKLYIGAAISLLAWIGLAAGIFMSLRRRARVPATTGESLHARV